MNTTIRAEGYMQNGNEKNTQSLPEYLVSNTTLSTPALNFVSTSFACSYNEWKGEISGIIGTYVDKNLAHEQGILKNIGSLWAACEILNNTEILAGIYPSHIGLESPSSFDCINPSRSIVADNSPYYQSGIRIRHHSSDEYYSLHVLNGWQRSGIDSLGLLPAMGYDYFSRNKSFNYVLSGFFGEIQHHQQQVFRAYQHIGGTYHVDDKFTISGSIDMAFQEYHDHYAWMIAPLLMAQWNIMKSWTINGRMEYYHDPNALIVSTNNGLSGLGYSFGMDWMPFSQIKVRCEYRVIDEMRNDKEYEHDASFFGMHLQWFISEFVIGGLKENL